MNRALHYKTFSGRKGLLARSQRNIGILTSSVLCALLFVYCFSNVGDIVTYYASTDPKVLPLTIQCNEGRLGNQMCTYATLVGLSVINGRRPIVAQACNLKHLRGYFQNLSVPESTSLHIEWNSWNILSYLREEDRAIPFNSNFIDGFLYPCSYTFFDPAINEIRREFRFSDPIQRYAQNTLQEANVHKLQNLTYVGMHVRRGDYLERWLKKFKGAEVNMDYFEKAVAHFRQKYHPVVFVLVSDDRPWCSENLSARLGIFVTKESPTPAHDLAILANCNHTLMTYGTFGFWGAYLAGGEVVYFDRFLVPDTDFAKTDFVFEKMYPPHWKGLVTTNVSKGVLPTYT